MADNSGRTTYLGPRVSFRTSASDAGPVHIHVPSTATFEADGRVNFQAATLLSKATTASVTSLVVGDGELMITDVAVGANAAAVLAFRSGNTTYRWSSTTATIV